MAQQINLYDAKLERRRDWLALHYVVGLAAVLALLVGAAGYAARMDLPALVAQAATTESQLKAARDQIAALGAKAASRKPDSRLAQELEAARTLLGVRSDVLAALKRSLGPEAHSFADYLRGFARQSINGLWLTGFDIAAGGGSMEIRGRTLDPALLPEYIRRLNHEKAFQGQTFAALRLEVPKPDKSTTPNAPNAPNTPNTPNTPGTVVAVAAGWHEFTLVPQREPVAAKLTQAAAGSAS
jgi:hypothetical protein